MKMGMLSVLVLLVWILVIILSYTSAQGYVPQYLKTKYSNLGQGQSSSSSYQSKSPYSGGGTINTGKSYDTLNAPASLSTNQGQPYYASKNINYKTKTKTGKYSGGCPTAPPSPMNAGMRCSSYGGCKADCIPDYQFPNGKTQISITCLNGRWQVTEEPSWQTVPSCQPTCLPQCQNNGICLAPNHCQCPENFSGPQCQFENKPCLNLPILPRNSKRFCRSKQCTIECLHGHEFPDGSSITTMMCNNGQWIPAKTQWTSVPDCKATCSPPCLNGGACLSFNVCQCPQDFRGSQCQYSTSVCNAKNMKFNGGYNCSGDMESFSCSIFCPEGVPFEFLPEPKYQCLYSTGEFVPSPQPQCIFPQNYHIISQSSNSHEVRQGQIESMGSYGQHQNVHINQIIEEPEEFQVFKQKFYQHAITEVPDPAINEIDQIFAVPTVAYISKSKNVINLVPKPGSCFSWGGTHYKTFDGRVFSFTSKCTHVLVKDSRDNAFSVAVQNSPGCWENADLRGCYRIIKIFAQEKQYFLRKDKNGNPVFATKNKILSIPGQLPGLMVTMQGNHVVLSLDSVGVAIKWDGLQIIHVEVGAGLWNRTEGLCGSLNGEAEDDTITKEGFLAQSVLTFASSWKIDDLEDPCNDSPLETHICQGDLQAQALLYCTRILSDIRFSACSQVIDVTTLLDACKSDYCSCTNSDRTSCICGLLEVYVKDCKQKGVTDMVLWRDQEVCPMKCSGGRIYMSCAPKAGQQMCGAFARLPNDPESCQEGCYCPEGTVLHENKCITREQCPCKLRGKNFAPGSTIPKECNTCTCLQGEWQCTQVSCGARCAAIGDPHYSTFDGKRYDFMGQCSYFLIKMENVSVEAENTPCAGSISESMNLPRSISSGLPSCTKTITIRMNGQVVKLKQGLDLVVNGQDIIKVPYNISGIVIRAVSSIFLLVELPNGMEIWWDGVTRVYVDVPSTFKDKTKGLCGTFNGNQNDDFLTPENDVEQAIIPFANKWKTLEKCSDVPEVVSSHPCDVNLYNKPTAEKYCSTIKGELFQACHWYVDPEQYYLDCLYDICACEYQISKCLCPTIAAYASECSRKGLSIDWRNEVRECGLHCSGGQKYQICGNSCTRSCQDLTLKPDCKPQCVEGCNCPPGEALDDNGECIPIGQCKCQKEGLEFPAGFKEIRPGTHGLELCTCLNGLWQCSLAKNEDIEKFPRANDLQAKCDASKNFEYTTCEDVEPVTCKNMHTNEHFSPSVCHAGCKCKSGHVLDTKNKKCVKPSDCPCHHGGRSYKEKSTVQSDCNTCTCIHGKWDCTKRLCSAECVSWGDSHFKTFDGRYYDYQGQCDFVLAKGSLGNEAFDITIQNVPCGSLGTSCSKSVTLRVSSGEDVDAFTLIKGKTIPKYVSKKHITIRESGLFVIIEAPDLGLVVHWDRGTRVYVKVDPRWKDRLKGLCGNYNDNQEDDFQTPSGFAEASSRLFGDSWRLQDYCPEALEILDTCNENPGRRAWALKKCGILKTSLFLPCHSEVPLDNFFERCVFDTCACDQGDDCQCLCTALAAYAQECNSRGVPVKWRSPELCPMQCKEGCQQYQPCISTCPLETCDNLLTNSKLSKSCHEDACIEGCAPKPCSSGYIYSNESYVDCIPKNSCKPICIGEEDTTYFEGDLMEEDECHSCFCSRGQKICKGQPCSTTESPIFTTHQQEQNIQCVEGWTEWINQDSVKPFKKEKLKLNDEEPLPNAIILNNLNNSSKCDINQMISIECLTIDGRSYKELGLDVECSLERGLICRSVDPEQPCPDFKIRVLCQCQEITTQVTTFTTDIAVCDVTKPNQEHPEDCHKFFECVPVVSGLQLIEKSCGPDMFYNPNSMTCDFPNNVLKIKPSCQKNFTSKCLVGMVEDDCAIPCTKLCSYYLFTVREKGLCSEDIKCEPGCVSMDRDVNCPQNYLWSNEHQCVSKHDCLCVSDNDKSVKPGQVVKDGCKECQCLDNSYSCNEEQCNAELVSISGAELARNYTDLPTTIAYLIPSVSPPPECNEDRFISLIQGDQPLPDEAFSASSYLSPEFGPSNSRMDKKISKKSGGSWAPQSTDPNQYLQIDLGQQEAIYGVVIKGSPLYDEYVTSFEVMYSPDENSPFYYVLNQESPPRPQIFRGSLDSFSPVKQIFATPFEATRIRIKPQTWNNAISLRLELLGCSEDFPSTTPIYTDILTTHLPIALCDDEMGLGNGLLSDQQIRTSSEISSDHSKRQVRLNSDSFWQPLTNSVTEWVEFDFLEPRDITGIVTKGGQVGWITSFTIKYSQNHKDWNPIMDQKARNEKIFLGNFDKNSPQVNNFQMPINARYLKVIPTKWHETIQLRVEIHGCFKPYPELEPLSSTTEAILPCNNCPGVQIQTLEIEACRCVLNQWFDGTKCVNRTQCPCMIGHIAYEVGSVFEKEDCSECICKLGGVPHCIPKSCSSCKEGLKSTVTGTCQCTCQPCPEGTKLCPTSNVCIDKTLWCNGIQDCPDDELDCSTTKAPTVTTSKPKICPLIECQPGFRKIIEKSEQQTKGYLSPLLTEASFSKTKHRSTHKSHTKTHKTHLAKPERLKEVHEELICPETKCVIDRPPTEFKHVIEECPPVICPPTFIAVLDKNPNSFRSKSCPTYSCYPPPLPDAICNITGRTFNSFDGTEFKYDVCNHVIARDLVLDQWRVSLRKNCTKECTRDLEIDHDDEVIIIRADLSVAYHSFEYSVDQIKDFGSESGFGIAQLGNTFLFASNKYGFWVLWNKMANVKLGVVHKLSGKIDGLCGFFNDDPADDKRKPDGSLSKTTADFGSSWTLDKEQPFWCEARTCPMHIQNIAWTICNKVKDQPLSRCAKTLDIEAFVSRCLDSVCSCLEKSAGNHSMEEECRCTAMQTFVVDCLSSDDQIDLSDWRTHNDCPVTCEAPLVYHDCFNRKCEPTCQSIGDPYLCPKVSKMCFPGCYCPAGYVKKGNTCIKPSSCRDCECNVLPHLQYVTYDGNNFTINGNCVYVMSRDVASDENLTHKWQVLITNHPCKTKSNKTCVGKVTILYQGRKLHILVDFYRNKLKLIVDNERISDFEEIGDWAEVRETSTRHLKILLTEVQAEVSVYYPSLGVSVKVPSHKYGGKLEGLCGDCNKNPDDDIRYGAFAKHSPDENPKDINDFALSWLYENLPGGQSPQTCQNLPEEKCPELPLHEDPCSQLLDENKFGQCLNVMDPALFIDWCKKDSCGQHFELSCDSIEAFARDCASKGFCVHWRNEHCPAKTCSSDQIYRPCANAKQETCEDVKNKKLKTSVYSKSSGLLEGCYCSEGKVLLNETCVDLKDCETCDLEGHHPGETWQKDKCTTCKCEGTTLKCETQFCSGKDKICERGYNAVKIPANEDTCCDKYACIPEPTAGPTCEPPQQLQCASDQVLKLDTKPNGCQTFICECKPKEECPKVNLKLEGLEAGLVQDIDENGCCPKIKEICKKDLCPEAKQCPEYHVLKKQEIPGQCCPLYICEPPKDKCIFESGYAPDDNGGEKMLTKYEKVKVLKVKDESWEDGPCRKCQCLPSTIGNYQVVCSKTECPTVELHEDHLNYKLQLINISKKCCPEIVRSACKFGGKIYEVGQEWQQDNDYCKTYSCTKTDKVRIETSVKNCAEKECKPGFKFVKPDLTLQECCGKCVQVACITGNNLYQVGEKWSSEDFCTNYHCVSSNETVQVEAVKVNCPEIPQEDLDNYVFEFHEMKNECCKQSKAVACKMNEKVFQVNESWPSPDGDKCKTFTCIQKGTTNEVSKQEFVETCKKDCEKGWTYKESNKECCGKCIQTSCIVNNTLKSPNETWKSPDGCTTYSCENFDGQLLVSSNQESCPSIDDCPKNNVYILGCCHYCNLTTESKSLCTPQPMKLSKTVQLIEVKRHENGKCVNKHAIRNFTECIGTCHSSTSFNFKTGMHESVCTCCQAVKYESLEVELECEDGYKWMKKVGVPSKCDCLACSEGRDFTNKASYVQQV
ncbi:hypothetical protein ABEB36_002690 [Hypothenemus hampei]|uniref:Hemocytin n=1 Tax=Hypothenemus hampei TaxID=57062 RepID=A0ABD1F6N4_HYPHA